VKRLPLLLLSMILLPVCNGLSLTSNTPVPIPTGVTAVDIPYAKMVYYDIGGSTEDELREQLDAKGPVSSDGYHGDALTTWFVHWNWDGYGTETCDLRSASATYDIKVAMPRWVPPPEASPALIEKWNTYVLALANHEKGHVDNVIANLPVIITAIRRATCSSAEAEAQEILSGIRMIDENYDTTTDHGATQGAHFP
jgi:predicted secreted Zn-dependent protease